TMTVLMATGNATLLHFDMLRSVQTMTAAIAIDFGEVEFGSEHYHVLFLVGLVLFVITFLINFLAVWITKRFKEDY
ncbi:MAG TPA: phosphate ABC transporter permease subunit PstC, partial [Methanomassiliicoccales archaeon]|nr:phosphate ABC transporter permease subunit PstC [Methanomassiliicoccales archaeon]